MLRMTKLTFALFHVSACLLMQHTGQDDWNIINFLQHFVIKEGISKVKCFIRLSKDDQISYDSSSEELFKA